MQPVPRADERLRICLCADDVGLLPAIDAGALELVALGRVHALTCMVGAPHWAATRAAVRAQFDAIDVGLHLDFTEHPLERASRRSLCSLVMATCLHTVSRQAIRREIGAQLDAFADDVGRMPRFVDGHQHVHQLPVLRDALVEELDRRTRAGPRPWLRSTRRPPPGRAGGSGGWRSDLKHAVVEALGARALGALGRRHGYPRNRALLGVYDFGEASTSHAARVESWLALARDGDLLVCHPGAKQASNDRIAAARAAELELLSSPLFAWMLRDRGITLAPLSRILEAAPQS